jgi:SM-20-related protein
MIKMLNAMDQFGWASMPGCLGEAEALRLRAECEEACDRGDFKRAGVGRGLNLEVRDDIRRDQVMWLQGEATSVEQVAFVARLELMRLELNQRFFLGLFEYEGHFAIYPEGAFYKAHLDRHAGTNDRIVTTILYLNPIWQPGDGGELKLWTTAEGKAGAFILIEPRMGTLVCFMAGDFWHEVLPAKKTRMSITGWFRRR